jgi:hypothetical protein
MAVETLLDLERRMDLESHGFRVAWRVATRLLTPGLLCECAPDLLHWHNGSCLLTQWARSLAGLEAASKLDGSCTTSSAVALIPGHQKRDGSMQKLTLPGSKRFGSFAIQDWRQKSVTSDSDLELLGTCRPDGSETEAGCRVVARVDSQWHI